MQPNQVPVEVLKAQLVVTEYRLTQTKGNTEKQIASLTQQVEDLKAEIAKA